MNSREDLEDAGLIPPTTIEERHLLLRNKIDILLLRSSGIDLPDGFLGLSELKESDFAIFTAAKDQVARRKAVIEKFRRRNERTLSPDIIR